MKGARGVALWFWLAGSVAAQDAADTAPVFRLGVSTGATYNSNRSLDSTDPGSTTTLNTRVQALWRLATPIQQLEFSGDVGLRSVSGADRQSLSGGVFEPSLALSYARQSRNAELRVDTSLRTRDVSATELQFNVDTADFDLLDTSGTQRQFRFDTTLELGRAAPFGITLFTGYTGLRYQDTSDPDLTDQDRFRVGARFRFDLNPTTRATLNAQLGTFEDFGTPEGPRETYTLTGLIRQDLRNGDATLRASITDTKDGTRTSLSAGRSVETALWRVSGLLGISRGVNGEISPVGEIDVTRTLPTGSVNARVTQRIQSGTDDDEQRITNFRLGYETQLTPLASLETGISFTDRSTTGATGDDGRFGVFNVSVQRTLTPDWSLNVGVQHRVRTDTTGTTSRDNQVSVNLRRIFLVRR